MPCVRLETVTRTDSPDSVYGRSAGVEGGGGTGYGDTAPAVVSTPCWLEPQQSHQPATNPYVFLKLACVLQVSRWHYCKPSCRMLLLEGNFALKDLLCLNKVSLEGGEVYPTCLSLTDLPKIPLKAVKDLPVLYLQP